MKSFTDAARAVLQTADAVEKAQAARRLKASWSSGRFVGIGSEPMPDRPARPPRPELLAPREMPKRRKAGGIGNRIALIHAIAHIELNAIDLSVDIAGRFGRDHGGDFISDWLSVADDEARHFTMLQERLKGLGATYGDLPAHDGLWEAALETRHDVCARLAVAHTVLEARGLDVTPAMIDRLTRFGDDRSAGILEVILHEETRHVRLGLEWFDRIAGERDRPLAEYWRTLVRTHFRGKLKPPFNTAARVSAGLMPELYEPLAE